jgi:hypothetical protein
MLTPGVGPLTTLPSMVTVPEFSRVSPSTQRRRVVFPHPDGPTIETISRSLMVRSMPSKTVRSP